MDGFARAVAAAEQAIGGVAIRAEPHAYRTSHELVELDLELADGSVFPAVVKETARPLPRRPRFVQRPGREASVYAHLLEPRRPWAPRFLAAVSTHLVVERIDASPLWQLETASVAASLGAAVRAAHNALAPHVDASFLERPDRRYWDRWFRRACAVAPALSRLQDAHAASVQLLLAERRIVIHGELYPSNVLVRGEDLLFVDWEVAAAAPAVVDIAAATTGWDGEATRVFLDSYGEIDPCALAAARLHLAFRWLGWSAAWVPPREHARDWQQDAFEIASVLGAREAA